MTKQEISEIRQEIINSGVPLKTREKLLEILDMENTDQEEEPAQESY